MKIINIILISALIILAHISGVVMGANRADLIFNKRWKSHCTERTQRTEKDCQVVYDFVFKNKNIVVGDFEEEKEI